MIFRRLLLLCVLAVLLAACGSHPKDAYMIENFRKYRRDFEILRTMLAQDPQLQRIDENWTDPPDPASIGITPQRVAEYRKLCRKIGAPRGFYSTPGSIDVLASALGLSISGSSKGWSWRAQPPRELHYELDKYRTLQAEEAQKQIDGKPHHYQGSVKIYRHMEGHWYLFYSN